MGKMLSKRRRRPPRKDDGVQLSRSAPNLSSAVTTQPELIQRSYSGSSLIETERGATEYIQSSEIETKLSESVVDESIQKPETRKCIVAAIDIGSAYSGYAFCLTEEFLKDQTNIFCPTWSSGDAMYYKTRSTILFKPDMTFYKFGYEAESYYTEVKEDELQLEQLNGDSIATWYYFQHFKMLLYEKKENINKDITIQEIQGKEMKAVDVFSAAIRFLKDHLLSQLTTRFGNDSIFTNDDVQWVVTVPAIWDMRAKQFMRDAAIKADICEEQLQLALEPEAASLYCRQVPVASKTLSRMSVRSLEEGSTYIILDQGGGTIDICVHEILPENCLKEIYQANGGSWGGNLVNKKFEEYLSDKLGREVVDKIKQQSPQDYAEIKNSFERKKRCYLDTLEETNQRIIVPIPPTFLQTYEQLNGNNYSGDLKIERGRIYLPFNIFKEFFSEPLDHIIKHLESLMDNPLLSDVRTILAVGGFSESAILITEIKNKFPDINIIVPKEPGLAVLKGAVLFGFQPSLIKKRISRFTYGIKVEKELLHDSEDVYRKIRKNQSSGRKYAVDVFEKLVTIGEEITVGELQLPQQYEPLHKNQKHASIEFYATTDKNPVHITDEGCMKIGTLEIDMSERESSSGSLSLQINAGGTEISALVTDNKTGKTFQGYFCLP